VKRPLVWIQECGPNALQVQVSLGGSSIGFMSLGELVTDAVTLAFTRIPDLPRAGDWRPSDGVDTLMARPLAVRYADECAA